MTSHLSPQLNGLTMFNRDPSNLSLNGLHMNTSQEQLFHPGQPNVANSEDGGDAKRRRIAKACDMCRKKKIKCDGKQPKCTHCTSSKSDCVFTRTEKKRQPPKGAKYIESLENRLLRMEKVLKLSGVVPEFDDGKTDLGELEKRLAEKKARESTGGDASSPYPDSPSGTVGRGTPCTPNNPSDDGSPKNDNEVEILSDMMCSLVTDTGGESRFIGSSTAFSIFSPRGIQWLTEKVGEEQFKECFGKILQKATKWVPLRNDTLFSPTTERAPLPPRELAYTLVSEYFRNFNVLMPIFDEGRFMALLEKQYSGDPPNKAGWYAALNMVFATTLRLRISSIPGDKAETVAKAIHNNEQSILFFKNATSVLTQIMFCSTDLLSIQALLSMTLYIQGTANPHSSYVLIAAASRLATAIGMHRKGTFFQLDPVEALQRKRAFWVIYIIEKDISLRSGRPSTINDDDISLDMPEEESLDGSGLITLKNGEQLNLFRLMVRFSRLTSKIYTRLYSAKAAKQSDVELLNTIGQLDEELEELRLSIAEDIRPGHITGLSHMEAPVLLPLVFLHFSYYNALTTIHRMSIHHGYWTNRLSDFAIKGLNPTPLNPRVFLSASICVNAARESLNLCKFVRRKDYPCVWLIIYYPMAAFLTLFSNILQNPQDPRAKGDFALMKSVQDFISDVIGGEEDNELMKRMVVFIGEFIHIAGLVLERAEKEQGRRRRRPAANDDTAKAKESLKRPAEDMKMQDTPQTSQPPEAVSVSSPFSQAMPPPTTADLFFDSQTAAQYPSPSSFSWLEDGGTPSAVSPANISVPPESQFASQGPGGGIGGVSPLTMSSFQQPVMPPDLWQMPMSFEWDWDLGTGDFYGA